MEIADEQSDKIGGHPGRCCERHRVLVGTRSSDVRDLPTVGDSDVAAVNHRTDVERCFKGRLIEARETCDARPSLGVATLRTGAFQWYQVKACELLVKTA